MKLVLDERLKHRLVGLAVIISLAAIFAPAIIKKSNQHFDENVNISVKLPPKPLLPKVAAIQKQELFKTVKVAHVELPALPEPKAVALIAKAERLSQVKLSQERLPASELAAIPKKALAPQRVAALALNKANAPASVQIKKLLPRVKKELATAPLKAKAKAGYAVQLATFTQQANAETLVSRLRSKGYKASYTKVLLQGNPVYKVIVGQANQKEQAALLQQQLAAVMRIKGFIIPTEVS